MKVKYIIAAAIFIVIGSSFAGGDKIKSGKELLAKMHKTYSGKWYKDFTFSQTTESYKNDSLVKAATWHETIVFPDYFRISFGDPEAGNAMIQIRDSMFNFRKGKLVQKSLKGEDLTFLLGGMYFLPLDSVLVKMKKEGYDINKFHEDKWQGKDAYVLGTSTADEKENQLWIDKEKLIVVRFIKYDAKSKEEAVFGDHKQFGKAWSETSCLFYINDKLIQKETYHDCKANGGVDLSIFDVQNFK